MNRYHQYMYSYPHKTAYRPISGKQVEAALKSLENQIAGLYLHLPFCQAKCGYCNLFSVAKPSPALIQEYLEAVTRQIRQINDIIPLTSVNFQSLTLGGGTPALLNVNQLQYIFDIVSDTTKVRPDSTQSIIELSPQTATREKVNFLQQSGFKRVSIGIQSFHPDELKHLGRQEEVHTGIQALKLLQGKFETFNLDLIYGIPGQTRESLLTSITTALTFKPEEVFLYPLYVRQNTPLEGMVLNESHTTALYYTGRDALLTAGYQQISMRRFVRKAPADNSECGMEQCLSFGCGGRSYLGNLHICEPYSSRPVQCQKHLTTFIGKPDFTVGLDGYLLNADEQKRRYVIKNLLHVQGIDIQSYQSHFNSKPETDFPVLKTLAEHSMIQTGKNVICLTKKGIAWSDGIGYLFISPQVAALSNEFYQNIK